MELWRLCYQLASKCVTRRAQSYMALGSSAFNSLLCIGATSSEWRRNDLFHSKPGRPPGKLPDWVWEKEWPIPSSPAIKPQWPRCSFGKKSQEWWKPMNTSLNPVSNACGLKHCSFFHISINHWLSQSILTVTKYLYTSSYWKVTTTSHTLHTTSTI